LEDGGSQNNEMPRGMWEAVETSTREVRMGETERRRGKRGNREKEREEGEEEKTEERENGRNKKSSRRMGNMGRRETGGEV